MGAGRAQAPSIPGSAVHEPFSVFLTNARLPWPLWHGGVAPGPLTGPVCSQEVCRSDADLTSSAARRLRPAVLNEKLPVSFSLYL